MNKLKSIGISALAGTLVSLSAAEAGGVTVTGNWEISYTNLNHTKVTGNKLGINKNLGFGASGDVSDGGGVTWATTLAMSDAFGLSSASMSLNMGGIATLTYDSGTGGTGANAVDNIVPTAWEEIDYGLSTGITDLGAVSATKGVVNLTVRAPVAGTGISISYASRMGAGHQADGATGGAPGSGEAGWDAVLDIVNYNAPHFGFRWGFSGQLEKKQFTCKNLRPEDGTIATSCLVGYKDHPYGGSSYMTLKLGPLSLGTQATFKDPQDPTVAGIKNKRSIIAGAALTFGDTISVSYGEAWDRYRYNDATRGGSVFGVDAGRDNPASDGASIDGTPGEYETITFRGWSAAVNFGPAALKATRNTVGGWGENSSNTAYGQGKTHSEINLSLAF